MIVLEERSPDDESKEARLSEEPVLCRFVTQFSPPSTPLRRLSPPGDAEAVERRAPRSGDGEGVLSEGTRTRVEVAAVVTTAAPSAEEFKDARGDEGGDAASASFPTEPPCSRCVNIFS